MADELVFQKFFRRGSAFDHLPPSSAIRPHRARYFILPGHFFLSFESSAVFTSGNRGPEGVSSTVTATSEMATTTPKGSLSSTASFRSRFRVSGGDLASPRYRR